ncbi:probable cysteine protease Atg4p [[Candida] jaroonii]|uniref:Probable cysteine protease Atg4p n=1 Tax=[Candida] jaroonii TaxID=467808 RepID=A0ACA9YCJ5_9ASCO|nr:probable cysteine protease Atg4p [[Candida] jaroonii]
MSEDKFTFMKDIWQHIPRPKSSDNTEATLQQNEGEGTIEDEVHADTSAVILGHDYQGDSIADKIKSLIWLSYRTGFQPIAKHEDGPYPLQFISSMVFNRNPFSAQFSSFINNDFFTTDVGWGCMIRTSQSLLANALVKFGNEEEEVIKLFKDDESATYSLHNFIKVANESPLHVRPGQWFGPNAASLSIQRLCRGELNVIISESSDLYDDQIKSMKGNLLVLLPIRLGIDKINSIYHDSILQLLNLPQSIGIAGGRPSSSFYFVGFDNINKDLLYLDPHYPQQCAEDGIKESFYTKNYQRLKIDDLDPSMMVGLVIKNWEDYENLKERLKGTKIVHFQSKESTFKDIADVESIADDELDDHLGHTQKNDKEDNDFVSIDHNIENEDVVEIENSKIDSSYDLIK